MKPIIFSTPMVKAILEGRKTQTRRVMKPQPVLDNGFWRWRGAGWSDNIKKITPIPCHSMYNNALYQPGDILWVKETWQYKKYGNYGYAPSDFIYRADPNEVWVGPWRSPMYMPREAARIFLRVKNIRVERLQDITDEDVIKEGITASSIRKFLLDYPSHADKWYSYSVKVAKNKGQEPPTTATNIGAFAYLWDTINAKRGCGWETNPWVWVIEFDKIQESEVDNNG